MISLDELDEKDCALLNLLQEDCRMTLTAMAQRIGLSVDATRKRLAKLEKNECFFPKVQLRPRHLGFKDIVEIKVKLSHCSREQEQSFISFLVQHPNIAEVLNISGPWDYTIIAIAQDSVDLGRITSDIRSRFWSIISDWTEALTKTVYKFENYDVKALKQEYGGKKRV